MIRIGRVMALFMILLILTLNLISSRLRDVTGVFSMDNLRLVDSTPPLTQWNKTYGGNNVDRAHFVVETRDGGYVLAGDTYSFGAGGEDAWLVKVDSSGNLQWDITYGSGAFDDSGRSVVETDDGGYILAGFTDSYGGGKSDAFLLKVNCSGNLLWDRTYGGIDYDYAWSVVGTRDGGYALAGNTYSYTVSDDDDAWLVKVDSSGNLQWSKTYGGNSSDIGFSVVETRDGGYALAGTSYSLRSGNVAWLVKVDSSGNLQWERKFIETSYYKEGISVVETRDGGYAVAGNSYSLRGGNMDAWLVKVDSSGNLQWDKTYGGNNLDFAWSVVETRDGGYALAGITSSFGAGGEDAWLVKVDSSGNLQWNKTYGGNNLDGARSVVETRDGGYALAGGAICCGSNTFDFWLIKTAPDSGAHALYQWWLWLILIGGIVVLAGVLYLLKRRRVRVDARESVITQRPFSDNLRFSPVRFKIIDFLPEGIKF